MAQASYLLRRDGRYSLQIRFTGALVSLSGRQLYRASLKTNCYRQARLRLAECLSWFLRMNDHLPDYPALFERNAEQLRIYLQDGWPLTDERLFARQNYEELVKNLNRRAQAAGFQPDMIDPDFHNCFQQFVRQNVEAQAFVEKAKLNQAYERGRADMRSTIEDASIPESFRALGARSSAVIEGQFAETSVRAAPRTHEGIRQGTDTLLSPASALNLLNTGRGGILYSEALEDYLAEDEARGGSADMRHDVRLIVQFLIDQLGDRSVRAVSDEELKALDRMLPDIPDRKNIPRTHTVSFSARYAYAKEHGWNGLKRLTEARLRNGYHNSLSKFFGWMIAKGIFDREKPIFNTISQQNLASLPRDAFREEEVVAIIEQPLFTGCQSEARIWQPGNMLIQSDLYWAYILLLLTGLRPNELGQLEINDVQNREGIFYLNLRPFDAEQGRVALSEIKRFKTESSQRLVPLHPLLLDLGLLDRIADLKKLNCRYLFPEWQPYLKPNAGLRWGQPISKSWQYLKKKVGIQRKDITLYSTRHWFAELIDSTDIKDRTRRRFLGHKASKDSAMRYGAKDRISMRDLKEFETVQSSTIDRMAEILLAAKHRADRGEMVVARPWQDKKNWSPHYLAKMAR